MKADITMLGGSGTGKTCYMYAMANLMSRPQNGFTFIPVEHRVGLKLKSGWRSMQHIVENGKIVKRGCWPAGTDESSSYKFYFKYCTKLLANFTWFDYRGGLLTSLEDEQEQDSLFEVINNSSCLIVCIAAEKLQGLLNDDGESIEELAMYAEMLERYSAEKGTTVPVVFAILKADKLKPGEFTDGIKRLKSDIFAQFFTRDGGWFLMFVGVSLGEFENRFEIDPQTHRSIVLGEFNVVNVHLPVFFAIRCGLIDQLKQADAERESLSSREYDNRRALERERQRSGWDVFWNGSNEDDLVDTLSSIGEDLGLVREEINKLKERLNWIDKELLGGGDDVVQIYFNGRRAE